MNVTTFLMLLSCCALSTSLLTEVEKKFTQCKKASLLAMITGIVIGLIVSGVYVILSQCPMTLNNCVYFILLIIGSGCGAMVGYDTIGAAVKQYIQIIKGE